MLNPATFADGYQPQWAAAHEYMLARGLICVSFSPGREASYRRGDGNEIVASLTGSRQPDDSYSIEVHGECPRARCAQIALAVVSREYVDLPVAPRTPWFFRGQRAEVACIRNGAQVPFVLAEWVEEER